MSFDIKKPVRVQIRTIDCETGSYPTISRLGDIERNGRYAVSFDDSKTIIFSQSVNINYPTLLESGSQFIGLMSSSIYAIGDVRKNIADNFAKFYNPGQQLKPFNEANKIEQTYASSFDPFHLTGSDISRVGPGFTSRLSSKTKIEIDLTPNSDTSLSINNGIVDISGNRLTAGNWNFQGMQNYPMGYFNFSEKRWEGIGRGIATSITGTGRTDIGNDPHSSVRANIENGMYGFSPSYGINQLEGPQAAMPFTTFGFPLHAKFHATSSQLFDVSTVIDRPFLVEKILYQFSASYHTRSFALAENTIDLAAQDARQTDTTISASGDGTSSALVFLYDPSKWAGSARRLDADGIIGGAYGTPVSTFFILNQRSPNNYAESIHASSSDMPPVLGDLINIPLTCSVPTNIQLSSNSNSMYVTTSRDLITYMQVSPMCAGYTDDVIKTFARELNIYNLSDTTYPLWGGEYILSGAIKSPRSKDKVRPMFLGNGFASTQCESVAIPGFRNGLGKPTGRDFVASTVGYIKSGSIDITVQTDVYPYTTRTDTILLADSTSIDNPYILMPGDKLVFGWQVPIGPIMNGEGRGGVASTGQASELILHSGKGKLVLYGSLLQENKEYHDTLNQPLTSDAIHEILHDDNPVLDQYDTQYIQQLSGTYVAEYITGSLMTTAASRKILSSKISSSVDLYDIFYNPYGDSTLSTFTSFVTSSYAAVKAKLPKCNRFVKLTSNNKRYYDTMLPKITSIYDVDGVNVISLGQFGNIICLGTYATGSDLVIASDLYPNVSWLRAFPFENRYSSLQRQTNPVLNCAGNISVEGDAVSPNFNDNLFIYYTMRYNQLSLNDGIVQVGMTDTVTQTEQLRNDVIAHFFGIGDFTIGKGNYTDTGGTRDYQVVGNIVMPIITRTDDTHDRATGFGTLIRGFRHGIYNVLPQYASSIFRRDHYGHYRDMLEQFTETRFFNESFIESNANKNKTGLEDSAVIIRFKHLTSGTLTEPMKTWSSNLSIHATSSLPYFDGMVKNRPDPIDTSALNTSGLD